MLRPEQVEDCRAHERLGPVRQAPACPPERHALEIGRAQFVQQVAVNEPVPSETGTNRRLPSSACGGSLQTSYRQPRSSTTSRVHASVKLIFGLDRCNRGLTSTTVSPVSDSSKKSGT